MSLEITSIVIVADVDEYLLKPLENQTNESIGKMILAAMQVPEEKELMQYLFSKYNKMDVRFWHQIDSKLQSVITEDMFMTSVQFRSANTILFVFKKYN